MFRTTVGPPSVTHIAVVDVLDGFVPVSAVPTVVPPSRRSVPGFSSSTVHANAATMQATEPIATRAGVRRERIASPPQRKRTILAAFAHGLRQLHRSG